jgi:CheY-like chemotaxis protein
MQLHRVIEQIGDMLGRLLGDHVALVVACPDDLPAIFGDPSNVEMVVMNLAVNARDAMPNGGTVTIDAAAEIFAQKDCIRYPERRPGSFVRLTVSDTGCGMSPEVLSRVFEPFFTTKEVGKGTGLGLATVYGIARQHEGWIEVRSQVGVGTEFDVYFPCSAAAVIEPETLKVEVPAATGGTETILAAEDEPALRELVQAVLEDAGYRVLLAEDGKSAVQLFEEHADEIDLLLTDMMMPGGMTGRELAEQLQNRKPGLRVIFSSGYSADLMGDTALRSDEIHFLQKPYDPDTMLRLVRACFGESAVCA